MKLNWDKSKYLQIAKSEGYSAALTALHRDLAQFELNILEPPTPSETNDLYEAWNEMAKIREFSRELWDAATEKDSLSNP